jgi:hypothetical protein
MASVYDIVCKYCGGIDEWYKYRDLPEECEHCGANMDEDDWAIFGVWSTGKQVEEYSKQIKEELEEEKKWEEERFSPPNVYKVEPLKKRKRRRVKGGKK